MLKQNLITSNATIFIINVLIIGIPGIHNDYSQTSFKNTNRKSLRRYFADADEYKFEGEKMNLKANL